MNSEGGATSLLDLLTNALAGVLLLMVVMAMSYSITEQIQTDEKGEADNIHTVKLIEKIDESDNMDSIITIQVRFFHKTAESPALEFFGDCRPKPKILQGKYEVKQRNAVSSSDFAITKSGICNGRWGLTVNRLVAGDSAYVVITKGALTFSSTQIYPHVTGGVAFLDFHEPVTDMKSIELYGRDLVEWNFNRE